jgi:peroxiredoxin
MKIFKLLTFFIAIIFSTNILAQQTLPSVNVNTMDGKTINITDICGDSDFTIVSFWATWCSPCKKELDAVAKLYPDWQKNYNVQLVAVSIDNARNLSKVRTMAETKAWEYIILSDVNEALKEALNVRSIPHTFLVDKGCNIVWTHEGYSAGDEHELEEVIKEKSGK